MNFEVCAMTAEIIKKKREKRLSGEQKQLKAKAEREKLEKIVHFLIFVYKQTIIS